MKTRSRVRFLAVLLALSISMIIQSFQVKAASSPAFSVSPDVYYALPAYYTTVAFDDWITCDGWSWNSFYGASKITFANLVLDGAAIAEIGFSTQLANMNVTSLNPFGWLNYTASTGIQELIYARKPSAVYFDDTLQDEGGTWGYTDGTTTITPTSSHIAVSYYSIPQNGEPGDPSNPVIMPDLSWIWTYLVAGDFFMFFTVIYTRLIGDVFWGLLLLIPAVTLYLKLQSIIPVAILYIGLGSLIVLLVPFATWNLGYILLGFGMAALLYKLFTKIRR